MAEKTRSQWVRAMRRWLSLGAWLGLIGGVVIWVIDEGKTSLLGSVAFFVPMGAAIVQMLWMSMYRYDGAKVWGWRLFGTSFLVLFALMAASIGIGCLQGICGER